MQTEPVTDMGVAITTSIAAALALLLSGIPKVIAFVLIILVGFFIAGVLAAVVVRVLRAIRFNDMAQRAGISGFVEKMGISRDASGVLADIVKWFVRLIVLVAAFDALGLPAVSDVLKSLLLFLPNLIVALVILVIAGLAAQALSKVVRGATAGAGVGDPDLFATIASFAVWAFGIVIAVNQVGVATTLVNTLFMGVVGALALAIGLAFGLGGRETAGQIVQSWYRSAGGRAAPARLDSGPARQAPE